MVMLTKILRFSKVKKVPRNYTKSTFIDSLRLLVRGGYGGNGYPKYGGIGGQGGDVHVISTEEETLASVVKKWPAKRILAGNGTNSHVNYILGPPGESIKVEVPAGITILREDGKVVAELNEPGIEVIVAKGGNGGSPNNGFIGVKGQSHIITLDLKLIADVGLVGFPNAGKSTLLKAVSQAKPKIANYPFTTIRPNVGIMEYKDHRQISMADLPGLIEGAHANVGMGHKFLKHVERTKLILLVVDVNGFQLSPKHEPRSCLDNIILLNKELELYKSELVSKPAMIVINKMDTEGAQKKYDEIKDNIRNLKEIFDQYDPEIRPLRPLVFEDVIPLSAKTKGREILYLKDQIRDILDLHAENEEQLDKNAELLKNTKQFLKERGPNLV